MASTNAPAAGVAAVVGPVPFKDDAAVDNNYTPPANSCMASTDAPAGGVAVVGPVPFVDVGGDDDAWENNHTPPAKEFAGAVSALPSNPKLWLRCYRGTWVLESWVPGLMAIHRHPGGFVPRRGDVVLASPPKCGTTWLKALAFATMARAAHSPPARACDKDHPLLRLNPHDCVPFMEMLFARGWGRRMEALPSPRLMATHMHHSVLPDSISSTPDCKIIYICRDPKDMLVSMWHFSRRVDPELPFADLFEAACEGTCLSGPIRDHVLGYWNASKASLETVLFLRYEEMLRDPADGVRRMASFVGQPFSAAEEEAGVLADIVELCGFRKLKNLEVNRTAGVFSSFASDAYFRKGEAGDWANHMMPEMARRLDAIVEEKLRGSGLSFGR